MAPPNIFDARSLSGKVLFPQVSRGPDLGVFVCLLVLLVDACGLGFAGDGDGCAGELNGVKLGRSPPLWFWGESPAPLLFSLLVARPEIQFPSGPLNAMILGDGGGDLLYKSASGSK